VNPPQKSATHEKVRNSTRATRQQKTLMTPEEVASMLGTPRLYVVRQAKLGKIPAIKVGKAWRFRLSTIEAWLASNERRAGETVTPDVLVHNEGTVSCSIRSRHERKNGLTTTSSPTRGGSPLRSVRGRFIARKIHDVPFIEFLKEPLPDEVSSPSRNLMTWSTYFRRICDRW